MTSQFDGDVPDGLECELMMRSANLPHETGLLLATRRVRRGHVAMCGPGTFTDGGQPFPNLLVPFLHELFDHGQARLEESQGNEPSRVVLTTAGEELLAELEEQTERRTSDEP